MSEYNPYLTISLFGHLFPGIAKNVFPGLTIFKMFWSLLAGVLIAVNMHYAKFTLWTPKLQTLAKTLPLFAIFQNTNTVQINISRSY